MGAGRDPSGCLDRLIHRCQQIDDPPLLIELREAEFNRLGTRQADVKGIRALSAT
jgi:hypothetical protein